MRFWDADKGTISIDGVDVQRVTFASLRSNMGYCSQNPIFFNDSILHNLVYSNIKKYYKKEQKSSEEGGYELAFNHNEIPEEILEACRKLNMLDLILSLPEGFQTKMGNQGQLFSGGERQRLSMIRTLLKDPQIYLFDEPTNGLDAYNEKLFVRLVEELKAKGKTVVIVSHNLNIAPALENVLYLKPEGQFEYGTHRGLLSQQQSDYQNLYKAFLDNQK